MDQGIDIRNLDEWMYAVQSAISEIGDDQKDALELLQKTLDDMREKRARLKQLRHNETGY